MIRAVNVVLGLLTAFVLGSGTAQAQVKSKDKSKTDAPTGVKVAPGETLNFKIEDSGSPAKADAVPMFKLQEEGESLTPTNPNTYNDSLAEDAPFRTYVGYPKNRFSAVVVPKNVAATWNFEGQDFNFRSNSLGYGVAYDLVITPRLAVGVDYTHSTLKLDEATTGGFDFRSSTANYDTYFVKGRYCFFGSANFFQQICPGLDIGNDSYPVLSWVTNSALKIDRLQDIIVGLNLNYQSPITDSVLFRATAGYNYGMGIGSSGSVTSKGNSSYYLKIGSGWDFNAHHGMGLDVFWQNRNTKMTDKTDTVDETWTTKSTELGVRLAYTYTL